MGLNPLRRTCSSSPYAIMDSNPDPTNFKIIEETYKNGYLILLVEYPDAKNYEGRKLMVYSGFENSKKLLLYNSGKLDPHFAVSAGAPIARFPPNSMSLTLIERMLK